MIPTCLICGQPLTPFELNTNNTWHKECQKCEHCQNEVTYDIVTKCLAIGRKPFHQPCETQTRLAELRSETLPRTLTQIHACNEKLLIREWTFARPAEGDYELLSNFLQEAQSLCKHVHYMLDQTKSRMTQDAVEVYRETQKREKQNKQESSTISAQEAITKQEAQERRKAEKEDPKLRDRRIAIERIMKSFGCDEATAIAWCEGASGKAKAEPPLQ